MRCASLLPLRGVELPLLSCCLFDTQDVYKSEKCSSNHSPVYIHNNKTMVVGSY